MKTSVPPRRRAAAPALALWTTLATLGGAGPVRAQIQVTQITDDAPDASGCVDPATLPNPSPDVNNMPQAEVAIAVSNDGRLAAVAKDYRYSPLDDTTYNNRVWNGLYLSSDGGRSWTNRLFEDSTPYLGVTGVTRGDLGQAPDLTIRLTHETDPVAEFDRDGNIYTCALAFQPDPPGDSRGPSASGIVVSRLTPTGELVFTRFIGLEADPRLFNDKNWIAVDRTAPVESTIVVASFRLFVFSDTAPALEGGYVAVSADGASSFGPPIRLPIPLEVARQTQFFQPVIGNDPQSGRKTLYVVFRTVGLAGTGLAMHVIKADLAGLSQGTASLHEHLEDPAAWTYLADRLAGLHPFGSDGWDGTFRFASYFMPAVDEETGHLFVVFHSLEASSLASRVAVTRSSDGGVSWSPPLDVDRPERGYQILPTLAVHSGVVSVLWYDSRHDAGFVPLARIGGIDVYYAELDAELRLRRVLRLTPETQRADQPVFTQARPTRSLSDEPLQPHDAGPPPGMQQRLPVPAQGEAQAQAVGQDCESERYGFIGDYVGLAADRDHAYAAWTDLRDLVLDADVCAGHSCNGRRNQNIYFARIPK
jgi:hypothetical protein